MGVKSGLLQSAVLGGQAQVSGTWQTTFTNTLDTDFIDALANSISIRTVIPAGSISLSGTQIRVTFTAASGAAFHVAHASIVERSGSTENGTVAPTELLFSGGSGFSISAAASIVSDALIFTLDETKDYLVIFDCSADNPSTAYNSAASSNTYYETGSSGSYNVQSPAGFSSIGNRTYNVTKIEIFG